jgi:hypothetical protein
MSDVAEIRRQVGVWLNEIFSSVITREPDGILDFGIPGVGSTAVFVGVRKFGDEITAVTVTAPVLVGVAITDDLFNFLGRNSGSYIIGRFSVMNPETSAILASCLVFEHSVLGEHLTKDELLLLCSVIGHTADEVDDSFKLAFGGELFTS